MSVYKRQQRPFIDRVKVGLHGEKVVMQYFKDRGIKFKDVRDIWEYQQQEIDFIAYIDGKAYTVEAKASENNISKYNSIMVKLYTKYDDANEHKKRGDDAYLYRTNANFIFYVDCQTNQIIIINTQTLKKCVNANLHTKLKPITYQDNETDISRSKYNRKNTVVYIPLTLFNNGIKRIKTNYKLKLNDNFSSKRQ